MRKISLLLLILSYSLLSMAQIQSHVVTMRTTIHGVDQINTHTYTPKTLSSSPQKIFIKNQTATPAYEAARQKAENIFSSEIGVNCDIRVTIRIGTEDDFSSSGDPCIIVTKWIDIFQNRNVYSPNLIPSDYNSTLLYPTALANYGFLGDVLPDDKDIEIVLNPTCVINNDFYVGTDGLVPEDKFDLVTLLLKGMSIGCGLQSTLDYDTSLFYGDLVENVRIPNIYDYYTISKSTNLRLCETGNRNSLLTTFLSDSVHLCGKFGERVPLYNDYAQYGYSPLILNCFDDMSELLSPYFECGLAIHELTPKTKIALQLLGWREDVVVDNNTIDPRVSITLPGSTLQPNTTYAFIGQCQNSSTAPVSQNLKCILQTADSMYTLSSATDNSGIFTSITNNCSYTELPNLDWVRDSSNNIIGQVIYDGIYNNRAFRKVVHVKIPYKPNKPFLKVTNNVVNNLMNANLEFYAQGANQYKVTYYGLQELMLHETIVDKTTLELLLQGLNPQQRYCIRVEAINSNGNNESDIIYVGEAVATLNMYTSKIGNSLAYHFKCGTTMVYNLDIQSINIFNVSTGLLERSGISAGIGENIDISSLPAGFHILAVSLRDGRTFNARFTKR